MFASLRTIWRALYRRRQWEQDLHDELRLHLECRTRDLVNAGLAPDEALRRARLELGLERVKEECRDAHRFAPVEELRQDLRYGAHSLAASPLFTTLAVLTLALGIGANTTIFSVINALVFRPLPLREPERLVLIDEVNLKAGGERDPTAAAYLDWKRHTRTFESMGRADPYASRETLSGVDRAEAIGATVCSPEFFNVIGVKAALGRTFSVSPEVDRFNAVISDGLWRRKFGADPGILGRTLLIGGRPKIVIGVLPPGFSLFPWDMGTDLWYPYNPGYTPKSRWLTVIGRLKPGVSIAQAQAELNSITRVQPDLDRDWSVKVESFRESLVGGEFRKLLYTLLGAVGFVLLIGCVNVANLLLARAAARQREMAIRVSLGAGRFRLIRQLLVENTLLALAAGVLGILLAVWGTRVLMALKPFGLSNTLPIHVDANVLAFTTAISLFSGLLFGLVPAFRATKPDLNETLKEAGRQSGSMRQGRLNLLLVCEVALAVVLLVGAGLLMRSFLRLQNVELGYNPRNVLQAQMLLSGPKYYQILADDFKKVTPQALVYYEQVLERLQTTPGVISASVSADGLSRAVTILGRPVPEGRRPDVPYNEVSPGYFRNLEIPLRSGRCLTDRDTGAAPWVVVINETMARRFFPKENPIGQQLQLSMTGGAGNHRYLDEDRPREIVGVVADTRYYFGSQPRPMMYGSFRQHPWLYPGGDQRGHIWKRFEVRTASKPANMVPVLQKIAAEADKDQPLLDVKSMEESLSDSVSFPRFIARLFGVFAALALFLAAVGIYGVISYLVSRRTHEMGIRMALGASRSNVLKLIIGRGLRATAIGLVIGILASLALTRLIARLLYNVKPTDPPTYIAVALILTAVAVAACYVPARRATRADPLTALRHE